MCDIISPFAQIRTHTAAYLHVENLSKAVTGDFQRKSSTQCQQITSLCLGRNRDVAAGKYKHKVAVLIISYHLEGNSLQKLQIVWYIRYAHGNTDQR